MSANDLMDVIRRTRSNLRELELFVSVSQRALSQAESALGQLDLVDRIDEALGDSGPFRTPEDREAAKAHAAEIQSFALDQKASGYSYLYTLAAVRLWGIIEACVDDLVTGAISTLDARKNDEVLYRLKGPLLEFRAASPEEQSEFLAQLLKNAVDAPLKLGIGRFEAVLDPCGLGGGVHDLVRRVLLELSQVRNLVVHRSARVDKRILEHCPWLRARAGEELRVSAADFSIYGAAGYWYLMELARRVQRRAGSVEGDNVQGILERLVVTVQSGWDRREAVVDAD